MDKILITSALPYVNNVPHLGNIIGSVLSADIFARACRLKGLSTFFLCATDEYGTATETKAIEEKTTPQAICDKYHALHAKIYADFGIEFDFFGRTSFPEQTEITQAIYLKLEKAGYILEQESQHLFCKTDDMFLADRFVDGICPHCGYENARGDQCDQCSKLLQPTELKEARCKICKSKPILKSTSHLYLDLPKLENELKDFFNQTATAGKWPENAYSTTKSWIENGLKIRPITRDLKWGVKVPKAGYENKVFYVWFDAVMGYISNTKRILGEKNWQLWWQNPAEVKLYQFMAKDNIPFHTIVLPAMMIGSKEKWTLPFHIASVEYLKYEGEKFSKSRNIGIFGNDIKKTDLPVDWFRMYLTLIRPETADSSFSWLEFMEEINSNFIDNIGNLVNRVAVLLDKNFERAINNSWQNYPDFVDFTQKLPQKYDDILNKLQWTQLRNALRGVLDLGRIGNKFFQDTKPWQLIKTDKLKTHALLSLLVMLIRDICLLLQPFAPNTAKIILAQLNFPEANFKELLNWKVSSTHNIKPPKVLFEKLDEKIISKLKILHGSEDVNHNPNLVAFRKLNICAGKIHAVKPHPVRNNCYVLEVDFGNNHNKNIVAGIKNNIAADKIINKTALFVVNLPKIDFDGIVSEGMLLTISKKHKLEILETTATAGENLMVEGLDGLANTENTNFKPASLEIFKQANLRMVNGQLKMDDYFLTIAGKKIIAKQILNGKIS